MYSKKLGFYYKFRKLSLEHQYGNAPLTYMLQNVLTVLYSLVGKSTGRMPVMVAGPCTGTVGRGVGSLPLAMSFAACNRRFAVHFGAPATLLRLLFCASGSR